MLEKENTEEKVQNIIERLNLGAKEQTKKASETYEFETVTNTEVFEFGSEAKPLETACDLTEEREQSAATDESILEVESIHNKEFIIPDAFSAAEEDKTENINRTPNIFTTYVPRFTEVSENYRMVNDPRPRKKSVAKEVAREDDKTPLNEKNESAKLLLDNDNRNDPTAEIDETSYGAVIVNMSCPTKDEDADTLNIFKFSEDGEQSQEEKEHTLEDEQADINRLISKESDTEESVIEELNINSEETGKEDIKLKNYTIPDPDSGLRVFDYDGEEYTGLTPDGVSEYVPEKSKKNTKEFELPAERDAVKDRFLDTLMGIKVRLGAAIFFTLLIVAFELSVFFGWINDSTLSLFTFAGATAVIDALLSSCVFLMALSEVIQTIKSLAKGRLTSLILLPTAYLVLLIYTGAVVVIGLYSAYPFFGFLFSVFSLSAILSTYLRTSADF